MQLLLLRRPLNPPLPSPPRPLHLLQHLLGRHEERSRALELLHRGPQDRPPLLALNHRLVAHHRRDGGVQQRTGGTGVKDSRVGLGGDFPAGD